LDLGPRHHGLPRPPRDGRLQDRLRRQARAAAVRAGRPGLGQL